VITVGEISFHPLPERARWEAIVAQSRRSADPYC